MSSKLSFFKASLRRKSKRGFRGYPAATVAFYGPDDRLATKVVAGIVCSEDDEPQIERWTVSDGDVRYNGKTFEAVHTFIRRNNAKSVVKSEAILGCPHEEGIDYPEGDACPECPFWAGRARPIFDDDIEPDSAPMIPDRRAIEGVMARFVGTDGESPLSRAQELMWDAWEKNDRKRRIAMARQALELSPDCADAYVMLAEETADDLDDALALYERGLAAGERAIGPEAFEQDVGHFWGILETRPYMRARAGLAECLREAGRVDDAIDHYQELLRLNPNDNQGNRYMLTACLLEAGRDGEARELLDRYPESGTAEWTYAHALAEFRASSSESAAAALRAAIDANPHVPAFLLGEKRMPRSLPPDYALGSRDEAVICAHSYKKSWKTTPGALDWLRTIQKGSQR